MDQYIPLLHRCGLHSSETALSTMTLINLAQMRIGLYGGKSSILMQPTYFSPVGQPVRDEAVAVIDCSETELRTAKICMTAQGISLTNGESFPTPGADYPAPLSDLLFGAVTLLEPFLADCRHIALALPFPLRYTEAGEVYLMQPPAHLRLSDWEGVELRAALRKELKAHGWDSDGSVLPIGTISAVHLGGMLSCSGESRYLSLHWGESFNSGFALPKTGILKLKSGDSTLQLLDCGSGSLTGVPFGSIDLVMDRDSADPGENLLNKLLSVRTLGEQYRFAMIKAVESDLLTFMCGREFLSLRKLSLSSLLQLLTNPDGLHLLADFCKHDENDLKVALVVAQAVVDRALRLVLSNLSAVLALTGAGRSAEYPALIALSGSAFAEPYLLQCFNSMLQSELGKQYGLHCKPYYDPDSALKGAAAAALLRR